MNLKGLSEERWLDYMGQVEGYILATAARYKSFLGPALEFQDLVQSGHEGFLIALSKFDETWSTTLLTYASIWITGAIWTQANEMGRQIHIAKWFVEDVMQPMSRSIEANFDGNADFDALISHQPLREDVAKRHPKINDPNSDAMTHELTLGWSYLVLRRELSSIEEMIGLDENAYDLPEFDIADDTNVEMEAEQNILTDQAYRVMEVVLSERERNVLFWHLGLPSIEKQTFDDIGNELGVTGERARQIKAEALAKLKRSFTTSQLAEFNLVLAANAAGD